MASKRKRAEMNGEATEQSKRVFQAMKQPVNNHLSSITNCITAFSWETISANAKAASAGQLLKSAAKDNLHMVDALFQDAQVHFLTSDQHSWVYHVPNWYRQIYDHISPSSSASQSYSESFNQLWELHPPVPGTIKMYGRDVLTPRYQKAYGKTCRFSGKTFEAVTDFPDLLRPVVELLQSMVVDRATQNTFLNGGLLNWYANGDHYMGPHTDADLQMFIKDSPIVSLSLGATRRFIFTPKVSKTKPTKAEVKRLELSLADGDLLVMGGSTQDTHKHALPKMKKCHQKRINLTLRCFRA